MGFLPGLKGDNRTKKKKKAEQLTHTAPTTTLTDPLDLLPRPAPVPNK